MKLDEDDDATQRTGACIDKDLCLRPRLLDGRVVIFAQLSQNKRVFHFIIPPLLMVCYQQQWPPSMSCEWKNKYGRSGVVGEEEDGDDDAVAAADDDNTKAGNTDNNVGPNNKQEKWGPGNVFHRVPAVGEAFIAMIAVGGCCSGRRTTM